MWQLVKQALVVVLCAHCLSVPARPEADDVVARVSGEMIRRSLYERRRDYLAKDLSRRFTGKKLEEELAKQERDLLNTLIEEVVLRQKTQELGILPEMEIVKYLDRTRREEGFNDLESFERFLIETGVDPKQFKYDLEQELVKDLLLSAGAGPAPSNSVDQGSRQERTNTPRHRPQEKESATVPQSFPSGYVQELRRNSIIEVKHGFHDTGLVYTGNLNEDLLIATRVGDSPHIRVLLTKGVSPNATDSNGHSGLMYASEMGHKGTVEVLLGGGADPNLKNVSGDTALLMATVEGYTDIVRLLLANNADANASDGDGITPLIYACANCKTGIVSVLLERKIDINAGDKDGRTALIASVVEGCSAAFADLLGREADPNLADREGRTALMYAVESGRKNQIQTLLEKNASVNARDNQGKTALTYAVIMDRLDLAQQLLAEHADANSPDNEAQSALMYAAAGGSERMVQLLLDAGADTKAQTWSMHLTRYNSVGVLLEASEPEHQKLPSALTALEIAQRTGHHAVVELLQKAARNVNN
jgi:ankyrin repeat protein